MSGLKDTEIAYQIFTHKASGVFFRNMLVKLD